MLEKYLPYHLGIYILRFSQHHPFVYNYIAYLMTSTVV